VLSNKEFIVPSQVGVLILPNSIYCGTNIIQIDLPERCALLGLIRENQLIQATSNPIVHSGDYILGIAIHPMMAPALKVTLKRTHSVSYKQR
jgi:Trk K+ transport system NAD-binding subunit